MSQTWWSHLGEPGSFPAVKDLITAAATTITASVAVSTLLGNRGDSRERSRPVIVAQLLPVKGYLGAQQLRISNEGKTVARDLVVTFTPDLGAFGAREGRVARYVAERYERPIKVVAPRQRLDNVWLIPRVVVPDQASENDEPLPTEFTVHVAYRGPRGARRFRRGPLYRDDYPLSTRTWQKQTTGQSSDSPRKTRVAELKVANETAAALGRLAAAAERAYPLPPPDPRIRASSNAFSARIEGREPEPGDLRAQQELTRELQRELGTAAGGETTAEPAEAALAKVATRPLTAVRGLLGWLRH